MNCCSTPQTNSFEGLDEVSLGEGMWEQLRGSCGLWDQLGAKVLKDLGQPSLQKHWLETQQGESIQHKSKNPLKKKSTGSSKWMTLMKKHMFLS